MKKDEDKTKEQLVSELEDIRQRVAVLEASEVERKRTEEALRESEEKLQRMFESATDGIVVTDLNGNIMEMNEAAVRLHGSDSKEKLIGQNTFEFIAEKDRVRVMEILKSAKENGQIRRNVEIAFLTEDGREYSAEVSSALLRDAAGNSAGFIAIFRDITERKRTEERLRESERRYRLLAENAEDVIWTVDMNMRPTYMSPSITRLLGYSVEEAMAKPMEAVYSPASFETAMKVLAEELAIENMEQKDLSRSRTLELKLNRKDGSRVPVEVKLSFIREPDGRPANILAIARDITERKEAEKKARELETLKEVDRLRSGLLANVSHELRTPLTSIKGFATTLLRSDVKWGEEDQRDFLQSIDQETDRLIRLINDLLDMSRIEAGGLKLEKDNYQIDEVLTSASSRLASLTEHHQLQVIVPSELPPVFVDKIRIGQVLTNLVENAAKFSGEGTQITIEAQLAGDNINISVTDRGEGIPAELRDKVFDRFYQAESIVSGRKSGTGLGLSICTGIIESHGGRIWVESKLGEGSKFSFSLPVGKGEEETA